MTKSCDACRYNEFPEILYTLSDDKYTYVLCPNCLTPFVAHGLHSNLWKVLIKKFPDSFNLNDDFYDDEGNALQPAWDIHYHIPPWVPKG